MVLLKMSEELNNINTHSKNGLWRQIEWCTFVWTGISCWIWVTFKLCKTNVRQQQAVNAIGTLYLVILLLHMMQYQTQWWKLSRWRSKKPEAFCI